VTRFSQNNPLQSKPRQGAVRLALLRWAKVRERNALLFSGLPVSSYLGAELLDRAGPMLQSKFVLCMFNEGSFRCRAVNSQPTGSGYWTCRQEEKLN
jgi:hypothetical protein